MERVKITYYIISSFISNNIVYQIRNIAGGLADNSEDHIERSHQDGKRSERINCGLTDF